MRLPRILVLIICYLAHAGGSNSHVEGMVADLASSVAECRKALVHLVADGTVMVCTAQPLCARG